MTINGKRIFNFRPMLAFAVFMIFGIIVSECLYGVSVWYYFIPLALFIAFCIVALCVKRFRRFFILPLALLVGFVSMTSANVSYNARSTGVFNGEITATVCSDIFVENGKATFYVEGICADGKDYDYKAKVTAYLDDEEEIDFGAGDVVCLDGTLVYISHNTNFNGYFSRYRATDCRYTLKATSVNKLGEGKLHFPENLQLEIKRLLYTHTDEHTAYIAQALVIGDKTGIDESLYADIKASGLAHVLAVSGLHVTTLATALYFLLKKLKVNPKISFIAVVGVTFLYSALCSFTASSLRAVIMSAAFTFASTFGRKRDELSAMSFAAILILLFRPYAIMDVGFLLSFSAVSGIFMFAKPFEQVGMKVVKRVSPKRNIGKKFASVCAVSCATNLVTYPFVAYFFGEVPILFVLSNFIVLPYIMAVYICALVLILIALITGWGSCLAVLKYLFLPFRAYVGAIGCLNFSTLSTSLGIVGLITVLLIVIVASKYVFLPKYKKARLCLSIASIGLAIAPLVNYLAG